MKLPAVVETLEGLDEQYHELYAEKDGQYEIQLSALNKHSTVSGLATAKGRVAAERDELKPDAKAWRELRELRGAEDDELSPEAVHDALEAATGKTPPDVEERIKEAERRGAERAETKAARELEKVAKERDSLRGALQGRTIEGDLDAAIAKAGFVEKFRPAVKALLLQRKHEMVEEDGTYRGIFREDPDGIPRDVPIDEFVTAFAESDAASPYMPAGGGGSGGTDSGGSGGTGGKGGSIDGSDPVAWGQNAEKIAAGEMGVVHR